MDSLVDLDRLPTLYELADLMDRPAKHPDQVANLSAEVEQQPMEVLLLAWHLANDPAYATPTTILRKIELMIEYKDPDMLEHVRDSAVQVDQSAEFAELGDYLGAYA